MVTVLSVEKVRSRYRIRLDSGETVHLSAGLYRQKPLEPGQQVDLEELDKWLLLRQYPMALDRAVELLAARNHSQKEIRDKLLRAGYRPCTVEMVLYKLSVLKLTDDTAFARSWAESRSGRYGNRRLMQELRQKGIAGEDAEAALAALDPDRQQAAAEAFAAKALGRRRAGETPQKARSRAMAALVRRGYSWEEARKAVDTALESE